MTAAGKARAWPGSAVTFRRSLAARSGQRTRFGRSAKCAARGECAFEAGDAAVELAELDGQIADGLAQSLDPLADHGHGLDRVENLVESAHTGGTSRTLAAKWALVASISANA